MSNYKFALLICFLLSMQLKVHAQDWHEESDKSHRQQIERLTQQAQRLAEKISKQVQQQIDVEKLVAETEKIARLSEKQANELAKKFENLALDADLRAKLDHLGDDLEGIFPESWPGNGELKADASHVERTKTIQKQYAVSKGTQLHLDNRYGKVEVNTWNKNEISVTISIKAVEASGNKADEIIDGVSIAESKSGNQITLKTEISKRSSNWWNNVINNNNRGVQINYVVHLPKDLDLNIANKYGAVTLPDLSGPLVMDVSYGSLKAGNLSGNSATINSAYGSATIGSVKNGQLDVKYGSLQLGTAEKLLLNLSYCGGSQIENIANEAQIAIKYSGEFKAGIGTQLRKLKLDAAYSSSTIAVAPKSAFTFAVDVSYGGFNSGNAIITHEDPAPDSKGPKLHKHYTGYYGRDNVPASVHINAKYGSIKLE